MSALQRIKRQIEALSVDELSEFRDWFTAFDTAAWDTRIETDIRNGKLGALADRALADHKAGRTTPL